MDKDQKVWSFIPALTLAVLAPSPPVGPATEEAENGLSMDNKVTHTHTHRLHLHIKL